MTHVTGLPISTVRAHARDVDNLGTRHMRHGDRQHSLFLAVDHLNRHRNFPSPLFFSGASDYEGEETDH